MGICYTKRHDGTKLVDYPLSHRKKIIEKYYDPYHKRLTELVDEALSKTKKALILDCHSFSSVPLPYESNQNLDRPDICIGTDSFHSSKELIDITMAFFQSRGYTVKINSPYCGTIVPLKYLNIDKRVQSIMLEINRGLYLVPGSNEKTEDFDLLKQIIRDFEDTVSKYDL